MRIVKLHELIFAILFSALIIGTDGAAQASETFILDKERTHIGFDVSYLIVSRVRGRFDDFHGSFVIDHDHPEKNRADIVIKTGSVDTGIKARDEELRSPAFFDTDRHPVMVFHSQKIELGPDNTGLVTGNLTLLGVTRPVTLNLVRIPGAQKDNSTEGERFADGFRVTGKIKRSDFGMNAYLKPIGNSVTLYLCYGRIKCSGEDAYEKEQRKRYNE